MAMQCECRGKRLMTIQLKKLLMICSLIAFSYNHVHAAEPGNDPLPTVQENVTSHKAILVDVREPGEWKQGHVEGAISLPLSSLAKDPDTSVLEQQLPNVRATLAEFLELFCRDCIGNTGFQDTRRECVRALTYNGLFAKNLARRYNSQQ